MEVAWGESANFILHWLQLALERKKTTREKQKSNHGRQLLSEEHNILTILAGHNHRKVCCLSEVWVWDFTRKLSHLVWPSDYIY